MVALVRSDASGGTIVVRVGAGTTERLEDKDGDGLAEFLVIDVELEVYEPGSYGLHGSALNGAVSANAGPIDLPLGKNVVELKFSGSELSTHLTGGPVEISLEVFPRDPLASSAKAAYTTKEAYPPEMFEAPSSGTGVAVKVLGQEVIIESRVLRLAINTTRPRITFSYSGESGVATRSALTYTDIIAYDDENGNGQYEQELDVKKYEASLGNVEWNLRTDFSQGYEISLHGVVPLRLSGSAAAVAWAKMTFTYRSRGMLLDGWGQKFDIDMELWQPLDVDDVAVIHELSALSGGQTIEEGSGGSVQTDDPNVLRIVSEKGRTRGIYSWSDDINVGADGPKTPSKARTKFTVGGDRAVIVFSYPISDGTLTVHHDPVIGMDPANMPISSTGPRFLSNRPLAMVLGAAVGVVIVVGTVLMRSFSDRKGRRPSDEDRPKGGG